MTVIPLLRQRKEHSDIDIKTEEKNQTLAAIPLLRQRKPYSNTVSHTTVKTEKNTLRH